MAAALLLLAILVCFATPLTAQTKIDFGSQIKPILSDNCFSCHGPDEAQRATDFRLDQKESVLDPELSVIVPADPNSSLLIARILSKDPDEVMPPADHRKHDVLVANLAADARFGVMALDTDEAIW